jgi:hypothetical protein
MIFLHGIRWFNYFANAKNSTEKLPAQLYACADAPPH